MAAIRKWSSLSRAEAVIAILDTMMSDDDKEDLFLGGFGTLGSTGITLSFFDGEKKAVVYGASNSEGIVVYVGDRQSFDYNSKKPLDTAKNLLFSANEVYQAAEALRDFFYPRN